MINVSDITKAMVVLLEADADVAGWANAIDGIGRGNYVNVDHNHTPWVGVYRASVAYEPRTLGAGLQTDNWEASASIRVLVQDASFANGEECEDLLELHVKDVIEAVLADTTIGGTVDMVNAFKVDYGYNEEQPETVHFQTAIITFDVEVKT